MPLSYGVAQQISFAKQEVGKLSMTIL